VSTHQKSLMELNNDSPRRPKKFEDNGRVFPMTRTSHDNFKRKDNFLAASNSGQKNNKTYYDDDFGPYKNGQTDLFPSDPAKSYQSLGGHPAPRRGMGEKQNILSLRGKAASQMTRN